VKEENIISCMYNNPSR